jgi:hypothetical protein
MPLIQRMVCTLCGEQIDLNVAAHTAIALVDRKFLYSTPIWASVSAAFVAAATFLAYIFPFFSTIVAFFASIGDVAAQFGLPCLFSLVVVRSHMASWEVPLCYALIPFSVVLSCAGIYSTVFKLIENKHV